MSDSKAVYQIDFLLNARRHQADVWMTPDQAKAVETALTKAASSLRVDRQPVIAGLGVRLMSDEGIGTALEALDTIGTAVGESVAAPSSPAFAVLVEQAKAIDAEAAVPTATTVCQSIEFIWDNGGGDDNAFAQSFMAQKQSARVDVFADALDGWLTEEGHAYDFAVLQGWSADHAFDRLHMGLIYLNSAVRAGSDGDEMDRIWAENLVTIGHQLDPIPVRPNLRRPGPR
jgi:hypothetical protein